MDAMEPMRKVAKLTELREDRGTRIEIGEAKILLVRDGDAVHAFQAECPHAKAPLDEGAVCNGRIVCPWHKATFAVADGGLIEPPALWGLTRYPVRVEGDDILASAEPIAATSPARTADSRVMLIVGAGAAGAAAAAALREFGFDGRVVMVGREPGPPFDRTALSKFVMAGQMPPTEVPPLLPPDYIAERNIERIEGEVIRVDVATRSATLQDGRAIAFDAALLATGGVPVPLRLPGSGLPGVHLLRTRQDAEAILASVRPQGRVVILGSSFIGLEVASGLREQGLQVTVVSPEPVPFARQFGARIGESFRRLHEAAGVEFRLGAQADGLHGDGRVAEVTLEDGSRLPADLVVAGVGVRPATAMIDGIERTGDGGLVVDAGMRVAQSVYAAGDIAAFPLPGSNARTRIEHWRVAQQQARVAARNMLGGSATYDGVPFFWTYQGGKRFEYLGHAESWDEVVIEGDLDRQDFVAFLVRGDAVAAIVACGRERATAMLAEPMRRTLLLQTAQRIVRAV